jgi:transcription-repair coupling factor (superfamily II helicase)
MRLFVDELREDERFRALAGRARAAAPRPVRAGSVYGSAQGLLVAALAGRVPGPLLAVALGPEEADDLATDIAAFGGAALRFPAWEALPGEDALPNFATAAERLEVLRRLAAGAVPPETAIVVSIGALLEPVPAPDHVRRASIPLKAGEEVPPALLEKALVAAGFERAPMVELPGEWSRRGGIVDIFPLVGGGPYRLEYFGDAIESIREFDPETQRSLRAVEAVEVALAGAKDFFRGADALSRSLLDYLPPGATALALEPARVEGMGLEIARRFGSAYLPLEAYTAGIARRPRIEVSALPFEPEEGTFDFDTRSVERVAGERVADVAAGVGRLLADGARTTILVAREGERVRVAEILKEGGLTPDGGGPLEIAVGDLARGFHAPRLRRAALVARELFRQALIRRPAAQPRAAKRRPGRPIASFLELSPGDFVVHVSHGIGRFLGIERMSAPGEPPEAPKLQEYLKLEYANDVLVYVPATKIELVQRYVGAKGFAPHLSTVGTGGWQRQKERVKAAVLDLAADLLEVQAARDLKQGIAFPDDDEWQRSFEASFPYEDTPDQARATDELKGDMRSPRPMDRLICGDVGYGKTEIAMRAAFKAAMAGKQVGVLVPTTVLAEQHLETFRARMAEFPVRIECVNRFRSHSQQRKILEAAKKGEVDILIGTHRILSQDVDFKDLGLVIIDEEQRFGVAHKERLKRLRKTVDVLTLTATPIPRTLHMSLLGIKDISALETPPEGRLAVQTVIARDSPALVREAILRELAREGQVFFVHNRVHSIERRAGELERLVPEARFAIVHGQMDEHALEDRMMAFHRGLVDVLVTTTIIESGLDIPRANTIFIDRADAFGLADLHQLRGRVGRYKHRAYAYLLLPKEERVVSEVAERRLKAIEEFNELGAGFRIAMRDLEIRGAGNILGAEQSGHIAMVGYDLYCRLLKLAVDEIKAAAGSAPGEGAGATEVLGEEGVEIELVVEAHLSERYIPDAKQKIESYRRLAAAHSDDELFEAEAELRDRFGPLPEAARALVRWNRLRIACERLGIAKVSAEGKVAVLRFAGNGNELRRQLAYSRARALWPEAGTCYVVVSEEPGLAPEKVLDALVGALCIEREVAPGAEPEPPPRHAKARAARGARRG